MRIIPPFQFAAIVSAQNGFLSAFLDRLDTLYLVLTVFQNNNRQSGHNPVFENLEATYELLK